MLPSVAAFIRCIPELCSSSSFFKTVSWCHKRAPLNQCCWYCISYTNTHVVRLDGLTQQQETSFRRSAYCFQGLTTLHCCLGICIYHLRAFRDLTQHSGDLQMPSQLLLVISVIGRETIDCTHGWVDSIAGI